MKYPKINKGEWSSGADGFWIQTQDHFMRFQRTNIRTASDDPIKPHEDEIISLCEYILYLEGLIE